MGLVKNKPEPGVCLGYSHANTSPSHLLECIIGLISACDFRDNDWWYVEHLTTKLKGYIPNNYVAVESSLDSYE